jgi:hypothetical protein
VIWVSGRIPRGRIALLRKRYPPAVVYGSKRARPRRYRLSRLDSYRRLPYLETRLASLRFPFLAPGRTMVHPPGQHPHHGHPAAVLGLVVVMIPVALVWSL